MSEAQVFVECPQCGYTETDKCYDGRRSISRIVCRRCGYREFEGPVYGKTGQRCGWKHEVSYGAGFLWYMHTEGGAFVGRSLNEEKEVGKAERWLRKQLKRGAVQDTAYLTRWNDETKQAELVIGQFYLCQKTEDESTTESGINSEHVEEL